MHSAQPRQQGVDGNETRTGTPRWSWVRLLGHVFDLAMTTCSLCRRGALRIIAARTQEAVSTRILGHLKLAAVPPPLAPARSRQATCAWVASAHAIACGLRGDVCATEVCLVSEQHLWAFAIRFEISPPDRLSRGLPPVGHLTALLSPVRRRVSRPRYAALRLAPGRSGGAAALPWARGKGRGRGVFAGGGR